MKTVVIVRHEADAVLERPSKRVRKLADAVLSCYRKGFQHSPRYQRHVWDGKVHLLSSLGVFPAGLIGRVTEELQRGGYDVVVQDKRQRPPGEVQPLQLHDIDTSDPRYPVQEQLLGAAIDAGGGIMDAATGMGKTEMIAGLTQRLDQPTLVLEHTQDLLLQTRRRLAARLGVKERDIGCYGAGKHIDGKVTVATFQTIHARLRADKKRKSTRTRDWLKRFHVLIVDEAHHAQAKTFYQVISLCPAYYRFGLSATPFKSGAKKDPETDLRLVGLFGEMVASFGIGKAVRGKMLVPPTVRMLKWVGGAEPNASWSTDEFAVDDQDLEWHQLYAAAICGLKVMGAKGRQIAAAATLLGQERNKHVLSRVGKLVKDGRPTLVLVSRVEHGKLLARRLSKRMDQDIPFIHGGEAGDRRVAALDSLGKTLPVLVANVVFDEGVDAPSVAGVVLAGGMRSEHKGQQRIGRGLRPEAGKTDLIVWDFFDTHSESLWLQSKARLKAYRALDGCEVKIVRTK